MKRAFLWASVLLLVCMSFSNGQEKVKKAIENGVEVVLNGTEPYRLKGQPSALDLKEEFIIDMENPVLAEAGLTEPTVIDLDAEGNLYLDTQRSSKYFLHKLDGAGNYLISFGRSGQGPGELQFPTFMMVNRFDEIFVVDQRGNKIVIFNKDGSLKEEKKSSLEVRSLSPSSTENILSDFVNFLLTRNTIRRGCLSVIPISQKSRS
ncbi:MAG: 6-bladed beta-propeller [Acidobacteriota bacterium]